MNTIKKSIMLSYLFAPLLAVSIAFGISQNAHAHEGHAGPLVTFMQTKAALKTMLPAGARIVKRKQPLGDNAVEWADSTYGVELDDGLFSYYLATDKTSKATTGAAYVGKASYRQGDLKFAVGIDANNRITQAAILGVNKKYAVDFEGNVGIGLIADYAGLSIKELIAKAEQLTSSDDKATREFAALVRDAAALLAAFVHGNK